jgi:hypothetical protein
LKVFPKTVEGQTGGQVGIAVATPICDGITPCRLQFEIESGDLSIAADPNDPTGKRFAKVDMTCADLGGQKFVSEGSDWVEVTANPMIVGLTPKLPSINLDTATAKYSDTITCTLTTRTRRVHSTTGAVVENSLVNGGSVTPVTLALLVQEKAGVLSQATAGKLFVDISSTTYTAVSLSIFKAFHDLGGNYDIAVTGDSKANIFLSKTSATPAVETNTITITPADATYPTCNQNKCTLTFYARRAVLTLANKFEVQQSKQDLTITHAGQVLTIPIANSQLFSAAAVAQAPTALAPGAIISVNGETGVAVQASLQNRTVIVESVHATTVPDDEYSHVSAGIVYAAVGSAFVFVLCLGLIAAKLGAKAAAKGV